MKYITKKDDLPKGALMVSNELLSNEAQREIKGGQTTYLCSNSLSELKCIPFTGSCLVVVIGGDTYQCNIASTLKIQKENEITHSQFERP